MEFLFKRAYSELESLAITEEDNEVRTRLNELQARWLVKEYKGFMRDARRIEVSLEFICKFKDCRAYWSKPASDILKEYKDWVKLANDASQEHGGQLPKDFRIPPEALDKTKQFVKVVHQRGVDDFLRTWQSVIDYTSMPTDEHGKWHGSLARLIEDKNYEGLKRRLDHDWAMLEYRLVDHVEFLRGPVMTAINECRFYYEEQFNKLNG